MSPRRLLVVAVLPLAAGAAALGATVAAPPGRIGPKLHLTGNGRLLRPAGKLVTLGHFPTGGAVTPDGRFYWTVSTGRALNDIRLVSVRRRRVFQTLPLPGASGGIAIDPSRPRVYVSGLADSTNKDEQRPGLPGRKGDVIHVFSYDARSGRAQEVETIPVPPPASAPSPQNFPPTSSTPKTSWPDRLAVSPDGSTLLVPLNLADAAAVVDVSSKRVRYVKTGGYPYGAAILPGGKTGLVSNETPGTVSVIDLANARKVGDIQVGAHLSHPEAIAVDPKAARAYVALANSDQVVVIDTGSMKVERTLTVERPEGKGVSPVALTVTPDGRRLLVAEAAADELAVFSLPGADRKIPAWTLVGRIPTAAYPADVQVTRASPRRPAQVLYAAGKGFGAGPNTGGPTPYTTGDNNLLQHPGTAVLSAGKAGIARFPTAKQLAAYTRTADAQVRPANAEAAPADTPLRAGGPIKHVFFIVRENRTYDQVLGDDPRGDGAPGLTLFGQNVTPNFHALVNRFPLVDHVYANSEASIDGHFWTSAGAVSDYVHKNWQQNYAGRGRPYDFGVYTASWPGTGFLFDQAERQHISYFNYGEAIAGVIPIFPDKDRSTADTRLESAKFLHSDVGLPAGCYPNDAYIGKNAITGRDVYDSSVPAGAAPVSESRFDCFRLRLMAQQLTGSVPAFNYMVLSNDHTEGTTPGRRTPRAMVAENDYALGQIVDLISHSSIWSSSAIFVVEDDSQDGADHVDAHRMPAAVFSPYAKRGAVIHTRYDMLSFIRSMELIVGMKPLSFADAVATPMYDAFTGTPGNAEPFTAVPASWNLEEKNAPNAAAARLSQRYHLQSPDRIPQDVLDKILWQSVHGPHAAPPPPGPNAQADG
ncbi:MAG: beta-propeller repeat protein [Solirubrobacterales bacterium]|nr:beta-propeller repeat protein [Solirubrobacterales bacterium]